jgi:hypothetical protein
MLVGQLTRDVKLLKTGFSRSAGSTISQSEVPPADWEAWVKEGVVKLPGVAVLPRQARMKTKRRKRAVPPG